MRDDALFRLYSMTRPITSLAAMILWGEDRFELDDPVSLCLPEFADQRVFVDASNPDLAASRPRRTEMTVEHLPIYRAEQVRLRSITLPQMVSNAARVPLFEDPGTRWRYGISTTILGRIIEIWSGMPFDELLQQRVFEPLGMTDTVFRVDSSRANRFGPAYRPGPDGELRPYAIEAVPFTEQPVLIEGGVGLVSTVGDYLRFAQMFLNGGELDGVRVLRPDTVALMTVNRLPDALLPIGFGTPQLGRGWTLGFCVVMDADASRLPVREGTYWWDGSSGTRFFIESRAPKSLRRNPLSLARPPFPSFHPRFDPDVGASRCPPPDGAGHMGSRVRPADRRPLPPGLGVISSRRAPLLSGALVYVAAW